MGGAKLNAGFGWAASSSPTCAIRPIPPWSATAGGRCGCERLRGLPLFLERWLQHQHRDAYWRHGSVCEDYGAIQCPVYRGRRLDRRLHQRHPAPAASISTVPRKGLIGPWAHAYPHFAQPGPADRLPAGDAALVGPLAEGPATPASMDEPMLRAWMTDSHAARRASRDAARPLGGRAVLAAAERRAAAPVPDRCGAAGRAGAARRAQVLLAADGRPARRRMVPVRPRQRPGGRPARGRRALAAVRDAAAGRDRRDPGRAGRHAGGRVRQAGRAADRAAVRRRIPTGGRCA